MDGKLNYIQLYTCQSYIGLLIPPGLTAEGLPVEPVPVHTAFARASLICVSPASLLQSGRMKRLMKSWRLLRV